MELNSRDNEVINLLTKLKNANGTYPQEMLALRRQSYLKQVTEIGAGAGLALAIKNAAKGGKTAGGAPVASKLLEALLVVAIVAEASTVAYFYRQKVLELFRTFSNAPTVEEASSPLVIESPIPTFELTPSPVVTVTVTETETPIATPSFELAGEATNQAGNEERNGPTLSTPVPNDNDNNGNQYGLTPKPERTKEPASGSSDDNNSESKTGPKKTK